MDFSNIDYDALDQDISNTTTTETTELGNVNLVALEKDVFGDVQFKPPVLSGEAARPARAAAPRCS